MKRIAIFLVAAMGVALSPTLGRAHCQVPCGIYDDPARVAQLREDATTIEKAVTEIASLAGKTDAQSANQLARWVATKDAHAGMIEETMGAYFLAQRIKPVEPGAADYDVYVRKLAEHHKVIVAAMRTKQSVDPKMVADLRAAIDAIAAYYPPPAAK
jgi:nickel superoxide dismutase